MSLSTLLEAAKYLDYLDSNPNLQQQNIHHQQQQQPQQPHPQLLFKPQQTTKQKSNKRQRASKKSAANTMIAMSLPASMNPIQMQGVPIPFASSNSNHIGHSSHHQAASLSSSFTTGSPLSSFASTALFCSKASGVTSASSSAASSLSSSDSSSSCGEILMGDNDFNQSLTNTSGGKQSNRHQRGNNQNQTKNAYNHHNYHLTHQQFEPTNQTQQVAGSKNNSNGNHQSVARYIAATSSGPQLVTMTTTSSSVGSSSSPIDSKLRAGHVIANSNNGAILNANQATSFDLRHYSIGSANGSGHQQTAFACQDGQTFNIAEGGSGSIGSDNQLNGSPSSCPPLIMARVQPMILNSLSPSTHQSIMAFQQAIASSPTSSSSSYSRHRELHKTLEKNRRAHLRHCFELLRTELPPSECVDKKTSHINIIKSAIRYVLTLRQQECEIDNELQRLTKIKNELTENLSKLRNANQSQQQGSADAQQQKPPSEQHQLKQEQQPPAPEQQLSFLLSQSKID